MEKVNLAELLKTQISLTEWLEKIGSPTAAAFRAEDNEKRARLKVLGDLIGLPSDQPQSFPATEVAQMSEAVAAWLAEHGQEKCALRLVPYDVSQPKYRTRGSSVDEAMTWFAEQPIDHAGYRADFMPHPEAHTWSTIFIVSTQGVFGEIVAGAHHQLTQGIHDEGEPMTFWVANGEWKVIPPQPGAKEHVEELVSMIRVEDSTLRQRIADELQGEFVDNVLCGYFEGVCTPDFGTWFIDYNRQLWKEFQPPASQTQTISQTPPSLPLVRGGEVVARGRTGSSGSAEGTVRVVRPEEIATTQLSSDDILVCEFTSPDYLPLMMQSAAVVTDFGGILSHAAIVCRELKKPCIVAAKNATQVLKNGDRVFVDADAGTVSLL